MRFTGHGTLSASRSPWHLRPRTWMAAALIVLGFAFVSFVLGERTTGTVLVALAGPLFLVCFLLVGRELRAARAEAVAMIDANLAARAAHTWPDPAAEAAQRAEILAVRERFARGERLR